jgi:hypothetical protein
MAYRGQGVCGLLCRVEQGWWDFRLWHFPAANCDHFSSNRCNAQFRELSEVQRTCRELVGRVDPTLLTLNRHTPEDFAAMHSALIAR